MITGLIILLATIMFIVIVGKTVLALGLLWDILLVTVVVILIVKLVKLIKRRKRSKAN